MISAEVLNNKGITFSEGVYTIVKSHGLSLDQTSEGLIKYFSYASSDKPRNVSFTLNDTAIPTTLMEENLCGSPREIVQYIQCNMRKVYVNNRIQELENQLKLVKKGEKNIKAIMNSMVDGTIPVPKNHSVEGVALALKQGIGSVAAFESSSERDVLLSWKKKHKKVITPETVDKVAAMDMKKIADSWQYRAL
jgi:hypothetical protein